MEQAEPPLGNEAPGSEPAGAPDAGHDAPTMRPQRAAGPQPSSANSPTIGSAGLPPPPEPATAVPSLPDDATLQTRLPANEETIARDYSPRPAPLTAPLKQFGRYRIVKELGRGGMGVVYRACDDELKREVALKTLLPEAAPTEEDVERFLREARSAAGLRHPNIVQVHDVGTVAGRHFFTMDFIEGESLETAQANMTERHFLEILRDVALALDSAHSQGVVHRDVKPANVLLDGKGRPFVSDFGLAKEVRGAVAKGLTLAGAVLGTPGYMSPEQAMGEVDKVGPRSDLWSLGVILYRRLTGRLPFVGCTVYEMILAIGQRDPDPPSRAAAEIQPGRRVSRDLETICLKCLEKAPERRYASAAEFAAELDRWLKGEPILARPASRTYRMSKWVGRHRALSAALSALLVVAAVASGFVWRALAERDAARVSISQSLLVQDAKNRLAEALGTRRGGDARLLARVAGEVDHECDALLAKDLGLADAWYVKGWVARLTDRLEDARAALDRAIDLRPQDITAHYQRGLVHAARWHDLRDRAKDRWRRAHPLLPEDSGGSTESALPSLVDLEKAVPEMGKAREATVNDFSEVKRLQAAAGEATPDRPSWALTGDGYLALFRDDLDTAGRFLDEALTVDPYLDDAHLARLDLQETRFLRLQIHNDALLSCYDAVIKANRGLEPAWRGKALIHMGMSGGYCALGRLDEAEKWCKASREEADRALELSPRRSATLSTCVSALLTCIQIRTRRGQVPVEDLERADRITIEALKTLPTDVDLRLARAHLLEFRAVNEPLLGKDPRPLYREALAVVDAILREDPASSLAHGTRGQILRALGELEQRHGGESREILLAAIADLEQGFRDDEASMRAERGQAWTALARVEREAGGDPRPNLAKALADLEESLRRAPSHALASAAYAKASKDLGEYLGSIGSDPAEPYRKAMEVLERAQATGAQSWELLTLRGMVLAGIAGAVGARGEDPREMYGRALEAFAAALRLVPNEPQTHERAGVCRGQLAQAQAARGEDPRPELERALAEFDAAIRGGEGRCDDFDGRGTARNAMAEWEAAHGADARAAYAKALADFDEALRRNPVAARVLNNRAYARYRLSEAEAAHGGDARPHLDAALHDLDEAVRLKFNLAQLTRGEVLRALGRFEEAIEAFREGAKGDARWAGWSEQEIERTRAKMGGK